MFTHALNNKRRLAVRALLLIAAAALLLLSGKQTWWSLTMFAPQYPGGLKVESTLTEMSGDVEELDGLNHYIGMMPLNDAAKLERSLVKYALPAFAVLAVLSLLFTRGLAWILTLPLISFPAVFLIDLKAWLWYAGQNLDPKAPLSSTISGFTPTMLGEGVIAQFRTIGVLHTGFYLGLAAALLCLTATLLAPRRPAVKGGSR
ncbi:MAG: cytochrome C [Bacillota bacterium]